MFNKTLGSRLNALTFAPQGLATPGMENGPDMILANPCWQGLQMLQNDLAKLPTSTNQLAAGMGSGAPANMSDFTKLVKLYGQLSAECNNFIQNQYPEIIALADSICEYADNVPTLYQGLEECITMLKTNVAQAGDTPLQARQKERMTALWKTRLEAIIDQLASAIAPYISRAVSVASDTRVFFDQLQTGQSQLGDRTGNDGYWKYYSSKYGEQSQAVKLLQHELDGSAKALAKYKKRYKQDVILASSSPTYARVAFPVGLIAASIVSGVFGEKARAVLNKLHATESTIATLTAREKADNHLMTALNYVTTQINDANGELATVAKTLEAVTGAWRSISHDLAAIRLALENDFEGTLPFLLELNFNNLIADWQNLASEAKKFRDNAFLQVTQ